MSPNQTTEPQQYENMDEFIESFIQAHCPDGHGTVSVWVGDIHGRPSYTRDELAMHYAASTMKLPLLIAAYRRHERGEIDLDAQVDVHNDFRSAADGSPFTLEDDQDDETWELIGSTASLRRLALHSIVKSGNLATNLVLERVGLGEVANVLVEAECTGETVVLRGIGDAVAREAGMDNFVTAHDLSLVMGGVASRSLAVEQTCVEIEEVLAKQEHRDKIPAGLPPNTYVANKTGWVDGAGHDVALVRPDGGDPFVLVVCTTLNVAEGLANELIAEVSRRIWEARTA